MMDFINGRCDYEFLIIMCLLVILFVVGLKRRKSDLNEIKFDKNYSVALKGVACIMILLGHYQGIPCLKHHSIVSLLASYSTNIALVWFMFTSGYGLSLSKESNSLVNCLRRCSKVFLPMIFVFIISLILYYFLPLRFGIDRAEDSAIPLELFKLHDINMSDILYILEGSIRWYWYVWCILVFYIAFHLSGYIASSKDIWNRTGILFILLSIWYIFAYFVLGESLAHYYRLTWAFFAGHLFAMRHVISKYHMTFYVLCSLCTFLNESILMVCSFVFALIILAACFFLNKQYEFHGKFLLHIGVISYFFYLSHRRIGWVLCVMGDEYNLIVWIVVTYFVSLILCKGFDFFKLKVKK